MYYVFEFMNNWQKRLKIKAYFYTNRLCKQAIIAIQGLKKKKKWSRIYKKWNKIHFVTDPVRGF